MLIAAKGGKCIRFPATKVRCDLEIEAMDDFNPHQIDWEKLFELQGGEKVESYIEDLSNKYDSLW